MDTEALGAVAPAASGFNIWDMVTGSGPVVQFVLITLVVLSVLSWAITIAKSMQLSRARKQSEEFHALFLETRNLARADDSSRRLSDSPLSGVFANGYRELMRSLQEGESVGLRSRDSDAALENVERALKRAELEQMQRLERGVTFLATVASAAPFIGLFGTVVGILNAFHGIGLAKSTSLQAVAPGISEALLATAVGLAAAIPAAVAFNFLSVAIKRVRQSIGSFSADFMNLARQSHSN